MKERPIIFSAPMVRAILDGQKTQTRRIIKPQPEYRHGVLFTLGSSTGYSPDLMAGACPYGRTGDRLWVREAFAYVIYGDGMRFIEYRADRSLSDFDGYDHPVGGRWRPSIHMPRWASRITLEITDVRVERLQDISGMDAKREGVSVPAHLPHDGVDLDYARREYRRLWQSINGPGSWETNPWVWVIEFKKLGQENDDA